MEQHGDAVSGTGCSAPESSDSTSPWRVRRFSYDSLSQLTRAKNPEYGPPAEFGAITYVYDNDGNVVLKTSPAPNQILSATQPIKYCYDELHRLTGKYYSDSGDCISGFDVAYSYDMGTYGTGRRTGMSNNSGATAWSYDAAGRTVTEARTIAGVSRTIEYSYDTDDSVYEIKYPYSGTPDRVVTYVYDLAGRAISASSGGESLVSAATYAPHGPLATARFGNSAYREECYNTRLQPSGIVGRTAPANPANPCGPLESEFFRLAYSYGSLNNGNVQQIANLIDANRGQNFQYDDLNRLLQAESVGSEWGNTYVIDAWGNLTNMNAVQGKTNYLPLSKAPASNKNQLNEDLHDAAGNLWNNNQYIYDAENRLVRLSGDSADRYLYDGDGKRVKKEGSGSPPLLYWTGTGSDALVETNLSGNVQSEHIFFNGQRVARIAAGVTYYYFSDHLGTSRVITDTAGTVCYDADYYPYGTEQHVYVNTCPQNYKFTGKEHDTETQLDYFGARYYGSNGSRWLSPDPAGTFFADERIPQTWNHYSYVRNNPLKFVDPLGLSEMPAYYVDGIRVFGTAASIVMQYPITVPVENQAHNQGKDQAQTKMSSAVFYINGKRTKLPVGTLVLRVERGDAVHSLVGTPIRTILYRVAVVTETGVTALNKPAEIQMQEKAINSSIALSCSTRCSNKRDPMDYKIGAFTDTVGIGAGRAFEARQIWYLGTSSEAATLVNLLEPGYYYRGTSTYIKATAESVIHRIE